MWAPILDVLITETQVMVGGSPVEGDQNPYNIKEGACKGPL